MLEHTLPVTPHGELAKAHRERVERARKLGFVARLAEQNDVSHMLIAFLPIHKLINRLIDMDLLTPDTARHWMVTFQRDLEIALGFDETTAGPVADDFAMSVNPMVLSTMDMTGTSLTDRLIQDAERFCSTKERAMELALEAARSAAVTDLTKVAASSYKLRMQLLCFVNYREQLYH